MNENKGSVRSYRSSILWKWTNYWNGWQPRWFILEDGILSYYKSEEEVTQGCKGSVCVSACDINVHPTDNLRIDIVIPGEQHICVRAASPTERQMWLVSLGSTKAQGLDSRGRKSSENVTSPDALKTKKSELRLYCDLLMQQVHSIKEVSMTENGCPDVNKLDENGEEDELSAIDLKLEHKRKQIQEIESVSSLLSATCDTFIKTLDDCLKITNAAASSFTSPNSQPVHVVPVQNVAKLHSSKTKSITHSNSN